MSSLAVFVGMQALFERGKPSAHPMLAPNPKRDAATALRENVRAIAESLRAAGGYPAAAADEVFALKAASGIP